jgi:mannan endo-1,4-beta-mannosidase
MKHLAFAVLLAILIHQQCFHVQVEAGDGFIRTRGVQFLLNGNPYYANGFNAYWLMYMGSDQTQRSKVSSAFREASSHGLNVARTWAFSDGGYRPLQYSPGSYNEQMFKVSFTLNLFHFVLFFFSIFRLNTILMILVFLVV